MKNIITILVVFFLLSCSDSENKNIPNLKSPQIQKDLLNYVLKAQQESKNADNDMRRENILTLRNKNFCGVMRKNLTVSNWTGWIETINTTKGGRGALSIKIGNNVSVGTLGISLRSQIGDFFYDTLIEKGTELYNDVSTLKSGQEVIFSGSFFRGRGEHKDSCLFVNTRGLKSNLSNPNFLFKFTNISVLRED